MNVLADELSREIDAVWAHLTAEITDPAERVAYISRSLGERGAVAYREWSERSEP